MPSQKLAPTQTFVEWLTNETIGVVILTSICAITVQNSLNTLHAITINSLTSREENEHFYWNTSTNSICYLPVEQMNANYAEQNNLKESATPSTTAIENKTKVQNNPAALNGNIKSNYYITKPHLLFSLLWVIVQCLVNFGIAYFLYLVFVKRGMKPFYQYNEHESKRQRDQETKLEQEETEEEMLRNVSETKNPEEVYPQ
jgi:hypothetical protein